MKTTPAKSDKSDETGESKVRTYPVLAAASPTTLILNCGDARFQVAIGQFIAEDLGLKDGEYVHVVVSGGVGSLCEPYTRPKEFKFVREMMELYLKRFSSIKKVVLISHEDCGKYKLLSKYVGPAFLHGFQTMSDRQRNDLHKVGIAVIGLFSGVEIERYFLKFSNPEHTEAVFEKL